mgnify:CR=1 FL=1
MAITNFSAVSAAMGPSLRRAEQNRYVYVKFDQGVPGAIQEVDGTAAVVTDAGINTFVYGGQQFMYFLEQAFAATAPQVLDAAAGGLKLVIDAAINDGLFVSLPWCTSAGGGTLKTAGPGKFESRTDGFFVRVKLQVTTVASADEIAVGVRKIVAFDTSAITSTASNTDFACLNVDNGDIKIISVINQGVASTVDTTQNLADAGTVTLEVRVSESGFVKFLVNGAAPTVDVTNFRFDSGDDLMPYIAVVADAAGDPGVIIHEWESGLLTERGLDGVLDLVN